MMCKGSHPGAERGHPRCLLTLSDGVEGCLAFFSVIKLECNCLAMLYQFLLHSEANQLIYACILSLLALPPRPHTPPILLPDMTSCLLHLVYFFLKTSSWPFLPGAPVPFSREQFFVCVTVVWGPRRGHNDRTSHCF